MAKSITGLYKKILKDILIIPTVIKNYYFEAKF